MKPRSVGLLSAIAGFAMALSITIASCDSNATDPAAPGNGGRGKGPQVLNSDDATTLSVSRVVEGGGASYDYETTQLNISAESFQAGGVRSIPSQPGIVWSQSIDAEWDDQGGIQLLSISDDIGETSSLTLQQEGDVLVTTPTFTGGSPTYRVQLYDNNSVVGTLQGLPVGQQLVIYPVNPGNRCCRYPTNNSFVVNPTNGACIWRVVWNPCCYWRVFWNGRWYEFNRINYVEGVEDEHYPYHNFNEIRTLPAGSGVQRFAISSEYVIG
jgi:hypothetical protein